MQGEQKNLAGISDLARVQGPGKDTRYPGMTFLKLTSWSGQQQDSSSAQDRGREGLLLLRGKQNI